MQKRDEELFELCSDLVTGMGYELVAVDDTVEHGRRVFRFYVDRPKGLVVDDCASLSREIEYLLDAELDFDGPFVLEVSSPGLDHRLRHEREYLHFVGRRARLVLHEPVDGLSVVIGVLGSVEEGTVKISTDDGSEVLVPLSIVSRARLLL